MTYNFTSYPLKSLCEDNAMKTLQVSWKEWYDVHLIPARLHYSKFVNWMS